MSFPVELPAGLALRRRTPTFTQETIPAALTRDHATKAGVWGIIHVEQGRLRYKVPSQNHETEIGPGGTAIVLPDVLHAVTPLGEVSFYVEFWGPAPEPSGR